MILRCQTDRTQQRTSSLVYSAVQRGLRLFGHRGGKGLDAPIRPKSRFSARFHRATVIAESVFLHVHFGMCRVAPSRRLAFVSFDALSRGAADLDDLHVIVDVPAKDMRVVYPRI